MITSFQLGNFKAFGTTQKIPIKPLTLIFGPNSAGKSSIIHGLLLLRHILAGKSVDARRVWHNEEAIDLGGFKEYVRDHNKDNVVDLAFQLDSDRAGAMEEWEKLQDDECPILVHLSVGTRVKTPKLLKVSISPDQTHPGAKPVTSPSSLLSETPATNSEFCRRMLADSLEACGGESEADPTTWEFLTQNVDVLDVYYGIAVNSCFQQSLREGFIAEPLYLGPLRSYPPRTFLFANETDPNYLSTGICAWDWVRADAGFRESANEAMHRFGLQYRLGVVEWVNSEQPAESLKELYLLNENGIRLSHRDLGMGISQVLPVIIQSVSAMGSFLIVEQPELHLHPALQAELGDLFIESALGPRHNTFLLETHSEHLILRILRRVRETTEDKLPAGTRPVRPEDVSVLFVEPTSQGSVVRQLPVTPDGDFGAPWPGGFFAERFQDLP